jgi:AhpD family alkylhydroperoxidase
MKLCNKTKELIAIGASVTANCQPCLQYHVSKAVEFGADEQEVAEAVETGKAVRKGAAAKMDKFASDLCTAVLSDASAPAEGCGCI